MRSFKRNRFAGRSPLQLWHRKKGMPRSGEPVDDESSNKPSLLNPPLKTTPSLRRRIEPAFSPSQERNMVQDDAIGRDDRGVRPHCVPVTPDVAHSRLCSYLTRPDQGEAERYGSKLANRLRLADARKAGAILLDAFDDIDHHLFAGVLGRRVDVHWTCLEASLLGLYQPPHSDSNESEKGRIWLTNRIPSKMMDGEWNLISLSTLVHEMLHAYLDITTNGRTKETCECGGSVDHGPHWIRTLDLLYQRFRVPELIAEIARDEADALDAMGLSCHRWGGNRELDWNLKNNRYKADALCRIMQKRGGNVEGPPKSTDDGQAQGEEGGKPSEPAGSKWWKAAFRGPAFKPWTGGRRSQR